MNSRKMRGLCRGPLVVALLTSCLAYGSVPASLDLGLFTSSDQLDSRLLAIASDPGMLARINQESSFWSGKYSNALHRAIDVAEHIYPIIMNKDGVTNVTYSVCAADARVYFWHSYEDHDVLGWITIPTLVKDARMQRFMTAWIVPRQKAILKPEDESGTAPASYRRLETAMDTTTLEQSLIFEKLAINSKEFRASAMRDGQVLQLELSLSPKRYEEQRLDKGGFSPRKLLRFGQPKLFSFWPPGNEPLDRSLTAMGNDPGVIKRIDQKDAFVEGTYSNVLHSAMNRARQAFPLLMDSRGATKTIASVCAADGRVYFENRFKFYSVCGWVSIDQLVAPDEQGKMTVVIRSSMVDEYPESDKLRAEGHAVMQAASAADISEDLVCKYLQIDCEKYRVKAKRRGLNVQIELSLDAAESDAEASTSNQLPRKLIRDDVTTELPFWPPESKTNSPSANENAGE